MTDDTFILLSKLLGTVAGVIVVLAITIPWIAQRIKKRRRCPKCWYDLSHSPGLQCSECGHTAKRERGLYRAKRARRAVVFALLLAVGGYAAMVTPAVKARGWPAAVPTTMLIAAIPVIEPSREHYLHFAEGTCGTLSRWERDHRARLNTRENRITTGLLKELCDERMTVIEETGLVDRMLTVVCRLTDPSFPTNRDPYPTRRDMVLSSVRWIEREAMIWQDPTDGSDIRLALHTRPTWPIEHPIAIDWRLHNENEPEHPVRWMHSTRYHIAIGDAEPLLVLEFRGDDPPIVQPAEAGAGSMFLIDAAHLDDTPLDIRILRQTLEFIDWPAHARWRDSGTFTWTLDVDPVDDVHAILAAVDSSMFDTALAAHLGGGPAGAQLRTTGQAPMLTFSYRTPTIPDDLSSLPGVGDPPGLSITAGMRFTILRDDQVLCSAEAVHPLPFTFDEVVLSLDRDDAARLRATVEADPDTALQLRISGDPHLALRDFNATMYWAGTIELPLHIDIW